MTDDIEHSGAERPAETPAVPDGDEALALTAETAADIQRIAQPERKTPKTKEERSVEVAGIRSRFFEMLEEHLAEATDEDWELLRNAFRIAEISHAKQDRQTGEAYMTHPCEVAEIIVVECGVRDVNLISALLLHDVVEDNTYYGNGVIRYSEWYPHALKTLTKDFNEKIARIVLALTKAEVDGVDIIDKKASRELSYTALREGPVEGVLGKMADRLHNLRTIEVKSIAAQERILNETMNELKTIFSTTLQQFGLSASTLIGEIGRHCRIIDERVKAHKAERRAKASETV